jgi:hypothetical protein
MIMTCRGCRETARERLSPVFATHTLKWGNAAFAPGFLATILMRVLKNDFVKYTREEDSAEEQEEMGWKYVHGDVFRFPPFISLFCAAIGTGTQLFTMTLFVFMLALVGVFYPYNRGALLTAIIVVRFCSPSQKPKPGNQTCPPRGSDEAERVRSRHGCCHPRFWGPTRT